MHNTYQDFTFEIDSWLGLAVFQN